MAENYGASFYEHFLRFMSSPKGRKIFRQADDGSSIQMLRYGNLFPGCSVSASFGLSLFWEEICSISEVVLVMSEGIESGEDVLANILFFMIKNRVRLERGVSVSGVSHIDINFFKEFDKEAIYFTAPYAFPAGFEEVSLPRPASAGFIYSAMFISRREHDFLLKNGPDAFEDLLEREKVDPMDTRRPSVV